MHTDITPLDGSLQDDAWLIEFRRSVMDDIASRCNVRRRATWDALAPTSTLEYDWDYTAIVIHNTGHGWHNTPKEIQVFDMGDQHWQDISYHYLVDSAGTITEGRELIYKGSHTKLQNSNKIGIVCIGDYDAGWRSVAGGHGYWGDPVMQPMLDAVVFLSRKLVEYFPITEFGGHIEFGDTLDCPGSKLLAYVRAMRSQLGLLAPVHRSL